MRNRDLRFRYPDFDLIPYVVLFCFVAPFLPLPVLMVRHDQTFKFFNFIRGAILLGVSIAFALLAFKIVVVSFWGREFIFDERRKVLVIRKFIFCFSVGEKTEIAFRDLSVKVKRGPELEFGDLRWVLNLSTPMGDFALGESIIKKASSIKSVGNRRHG